MYVKSMSNITIFIQKNQAKKIESRKTGFYFYNTSMLYKNYPIYPAALRCSSAFARLAVETRMIGPVHPIPLSA